MKCLKYLFVLSFILAYILFDVNIGYTNGSPLYTHITYIFQHASILHLVINSFAFIGLYTTLERFIDTWLFLAITFSMAVLASFIDITINPYRLLPTVGISSVVYAMIGLYVGITLLLDNIKIADTRKYLLFIFCILLALSISFFNENSNFTIHLISLILGTTASVFITVFNKYPK